MSHNVTTRDGVFTVRKAAWWDTQGEHVLSDYPSRKEAQEIAHPWEPISEPVYRKVVRISDEGHPYGAFEQIDGQQAIVRSDDLSETGVLGVVPDTYEPVKNDVMYDIAEALEGEARGNNLPVQFETGGSLKGGRKVWLLLRLAEPITVQGDPNGATIPYYALQNAHDGSGAFRGQGVMTRIVCDNTSQAADLEAQARNTEFAFHHTKNVGDRIEEAKSALAGWREGITVWHRTMNHLIDQPITRQQRNLFIDQFIPAPPVHMATERVMNNVEASRLVLRDIFDSATMENIGFTAYGLVQASIEYNQHYRRARSAESRFKRVYLDRSQVTADAVQLAEALVSS